MMQPQYKASLHLVKRAAERTAILHSRMMNDAIAQVDFEERVRSMNAQKQSEIHQLLSVVLAKVSSGQITKVA